MKVLLLSCTLIKIWLVLRDDTFYHLLFPVFFGNFLYRDGHVCRIAPQCLDYVLRDLLGTKLLLFLCPSGITLDIYVRHSKASLLRLRLLYHKEGGIYNPTAGWLSFSSAQFIEPVLILIHETVDLVYEVCHVISLRIEDPSSHCCGELIGLAG